MGHLEQARNPLSLSRYRLITQREEILRDSCCVSRGGGQEVTSGLRNYQRISGLIRYLVISRLAFRGTGQFLHYLKQNDCFGSIQKQRVLVFRLNRNKQKSNRNSVMDSIFTKFRVVSVCFGLFRNSLFRNSLFRNSLLRLFRFFTETESLIF